MQTHYGHPVRSVTWREVEHAIGFDLHLTDVGAPGFALSVVAGPAETPEIVESRRGRQVIRMRMTWGKSRGAAGQVTSVQHWYSGDGGAHYARIVDESGNGVLRFSYNASGTLVAQEWRPSRRGRQVTPSPAGARSRYSKRS